jgi:protein-S-isoprenylcysteine O-methyltransferase Ste14
MLSEKYFHVGVLGMRFVSDAFWIHVVGIVITSIGMAFTIWARATLSDNWSPNITLKEQHQLIRSGPYALVRHPIYTGFSFALIGGVLQIGEYRAIVAYAILLIAHSMKAKREEKLMAAQFGQQYAEYRKHSGFLIPRFR